MTYHEDCSKPYVPPSAYGGRINTPREKAIMSFCMKAGHWLIRMRKHAIWLLIPIAVVLVWLALKIKGLTFMDLLNGLEAIKGTMWIGGMR
jgi:hypothetical protein